MGNGGVIEMGAIFTGLLAGWLAAASAQSNESSVPAEAVRAIPAPAAPAVPPGGCCALPALTPVRVEMLATLNSNISKIGEHFAIRLAAPIDLPDGTQIPAGIIGSGDVVQAAKSGFAGKPGELIVAARYLDYQGIRIPLRSLTFNAAPTSGQTGKDRTDTAATVVIAVGLVGMFVSGGQVNIPAGTIGFAKTSAVVTVPSPGATQPAIPAAVPSSASVPTAPTTTTVTAAAPTLSEKGSSHP